MSCREVSTRPRPKVHPNVAGSCQSVVRPRTGTIVFGPALRAVKVGTPAVPFVLP
jgi:hypothetical protein